MGNLLSKHLSCVLTSLSKSVSFCLFFVVVVVVFWVSISPAQRIPAVIGREAGYTLDSLSQGPLWLHIIDASAPMPIDAYEARASDSFCCFWYLRNSQTFSSFSCLTARTNQIWREYYSMQHTPSDLCSSGRRTCFFCFEIGLFKNLLYTLKREIGSRLVRSVYVQNKNLNFSISIWTSITMWLLQQPTFTAGPELNHQPVNHHELSQPLYRCSCIPPLASYVIQNKQKSSWSHIKRSLILKSRPNSDCKTEGGTIFVVFSKNSLK